jgi:translocator protein
MTINVNILIIFVPLLFGFIVGSFSKPDTWYSKLNKPVLNPPKLIFPIAWTILYLLIGLAYYLALNNKSIEYWIIPIIHLLLNFCYSPLMFIYKQLLASAIITLLILLTAIIVIYQFYTYKQYISVYLLIPYIIWLLFANYLAWSVYLLN